MDLLFPVANGWINHGFDEPRNFEGKQIIHGGYDIVGNGHPIYTLACCDSIVIAAGWSDTFGQRVWLQPTDDKIRKAYPFFIYAHHESLKVQTGKILKKGDIVGIMGNTGYSHGVHLHFGAATKPNLPRKNLRIPEMDKVFIEPVIVKA